MFIKQISSTNYQKYKDQGLVILGFPCDQFAHQEPGSDEEIAEPAMALS